MAVISDSPRIRAIARAVLAIAVVQALFWLVLMPLITPKDMPHDRLKIYGIEMAELSSADWSEVGKARFARIETPYETCCKTGYRAFRSYFDLPAVPDGGLAIVPVIDVDNFTVRVNGSLIFAEGRMDMPNQTYDGLFRGTFRIPASALKTGRNEVVYTTVRGPGTPFVYFNDYTVGTYAPVKAHYRQREFMLNGYALISITIAYLVAALAFIAWLRGGRNPYLFWLGVLALCWALRLHHDEIMDPLLRGKARLTFLLFFTTLLPVAWLNLADSWDGQRIRWLQGASLTLFGLVFGAFAWIVWADLQGGSATVDEYSTVFSGVLSLGTVLLFVRKFIREQQERQWELAIYVVLCTLMFRDGLHVFFDVRDGRMVTLEMVVPILLAGLVIAFVARNVRLFQSQGQINALLQTQLDQRTAELEAAHSREKAMVMTQAHQAERQRIMRDMHDGLGSNLMSMLLMAKRGKVEAPVVAEGLQTVIDEMRLMIDSMDSVGESLQSALTIFRDRMQSRVEAAGKRFVWNQADIALPGYGPRGVLQVFRVMQEAVSNALKHSSGDTVSISVVAPTHSDHALRIVVADNGAGLGAANARGRGMANMAGRAEAIGAGLEIVDSDKGVSVVLDLPRAGSAFEA
ncbi:MAG: sensor histidine kinase [Novosphingobium sp.]